MKELLNKIDPKVSKPVLKFMAGVLWFATGILLTVMGVYWVWNSDNKHAVYFGLGGILASLLIHHLGFSRIVNKNLKRIASIKGRSCLFGFLSWKSYLIIAVMMTIGITLRHSSIPKIDISPIYIGIGTALVLSSLIYFRHVRE